MNFTQEIQKKYGPLPAWGWVVVGGGIGYWYIKHRASGTTQNASTGQPTTQYLGAGTAGLGTVDAPVNTSTTVPPTSTAPTNTTPFSGCPPGQVQLPTTTQCFPILQCTPPEVSCQGGLACCQPNGGPTGNTSPPITTFQGCPPGQVQLPLTTQCVPALTCPPGQYSCQGGLACCSPNQTTPFTSQNPIPTSCPPGTQQITLPGGGIGPCIPVGGAAIVSAPASAHGH